MGAYWHFLFCFAEFYIFVKIEGFGVSNSLAGQVENISSLFHKVSSNLVISNPGLPHVEVVPKTYPTRTGCMCANTGEAALGRRKVRRHDPTH